MNNYFNNLISYALIFPFSMGYVNANELEAKRCIVQSVDSSSMSKSIQYYVVGYEDGMHHSAVSGNNLITAEENIEKKDLESCLPIISKYNADNIFFNYNQFNLDDDQERKLNKLYKSDIEGKVIKKIIIDGYSDSSGDPNYNMTLSIKRANFVSNYLVSLGLKKDLIVTRGFGESKNDNKIVDQSERKVVISII
jgi:outer membrane protein OmpA-like peptidoglycan-associated protein